MNSNREKHRLYMRKYRKTQQHKEYMKQYFSTYYKRHDARKKKNERQRAYRLKNGYPKQISITKFKWYLKNTYNISLEVYEGLLKKQKYKCAICKSHYTVYKYRLSVDHNHKTGKIRGLLCHHCNSALGNFMDNVCNLKSAIIYMKEFK